MSALPHASRVLERLVRFPDDVGSTHARIQTSSREYVIPLSQPLDILCALWGAGHGDAMYDAFTACLDNEAQS